MYVTELLYNIPVYQRFYIKRNESPLAAKVEGGRPVIDNCFCCRMMLPRNDLEGIWLLSFIKLAPPNNGVPTDVVLTMRFIFIFYYVRPACTYEFVQPYKISANALAH